jgi:hypothetical protein
MAVTSFQSLGRRRFWALCAELLRAEGFTAPDGLSRFREGGHPIVVEEYRSHADRTIRIVWHVECIFHGDPEHWVEPEETEALLREYESRREPEEGLFLIVDTLLDEAALTLIDEYVVRHQDAKVTLWDRRQLAARLDRHPYIRHRYGLSLVKSDYLSVLSVLGELGPIPTLLISDQSAMAHHVTSGLRVAGFDVVFLPFWNYADPSRLTLAHDSVLQQDFRLVICFLGDSFTLRLPRSLVDTMLRAHDGGGSLLLFPFLAWTIHRGLHSPLEDIVPVTVQNPQLFSPESAVDRVAGSYRRGDFRFLLSFDSFAEDLYVEMDPAAGRAPFTDGIDSRFGLSHSFEFLAVKRGAQLAWADTTGNPLVVVSEAGGARVCYLNTCCHSCVNPVPVLSPLEASVHAGSLLRNIIRWLVA